MGILFYNDYGKFCRNLNLSEVINVEDYVTVPLS